MDFLSLVTGDKNFSTYIYLRLQVAAFCISEYYYRTHIIEQVHLARGLNLSERLAVFEAIRVYHLQKGNFKMPGKEFYTEYEGESQLYYDKYGDAHTNPRDAARYDTSEDERRGRRHREEEKRQERRKAEEKKRRDRDERKKNEAIELVRSTKENRQAEKDRKEHKVLSRDFGFNPLDFDSEEDRKQNGKGKERAEDWGGSSSRRDDRKGSSSNRKHKH